MQDKAGEWVPAVDPVHYDKSMAGVGPARTFANLLADSDPSITVGLVPAALRRLPDFQLGAREKVGADEQSSV